MDKRALLDSVDKIASSAHLGLFGESAGLSTFLFHSIFRNANEMNSNQVNPQERMTVDLFRQFLDYFLENGYRFITPEAIRDGLHANNERYGLITFDDGYFNNTLVTDILVEYKMPAVFFFSTAYITEGKKFWPDIVYQKRKEQGRSDLEILHEIMRLKSQATAAIESFVINEFGEGCMQPLSDTDRPMTAAELTAFTQCPYVHIGNHTHQHEILTNLSREGVDKEFETSQQLLTQLTGKKPWFVSYPNGSFSDMIIASAIQNGLTMGITTVMQKNKLPLRANKNGQILLDRFNPAADKFGKNNFKTLRSSLQLKTQLKKWLQ
jgi:peptidoglycan/xylan/chitin deacetylase (PgdA/CDA1 family)